MISFDPMRLETEFYQLGLAQSDADLRAAQRLRYQVFVEEMGAEVSAADHVAGLERDRFDPHFDHLLLRDLRIDDPNKQVVGTYRVMQGDKTQETGFYSADEFDLSVLIASGRKLLELGRSCIHADHRGGAALHILWNGLAEYIAKNEIEVLFGTASFHGTDSKAIEDALSFLHHRHLAPQHLRVTAADPNGISMNRLDADQVDRRAAVGMLPPLLKAYLRLGGTIGQGAWVDHNFNTIDVCLILDINDVPKEQRALYQKSPDT